MGSTAGTGFSTKISNYLGELLFTGAFETPFLDAIGGGLNGALGVGIISTNVDKDNKFAMSQTSSLDTPSQDVVTETVASGAGTPKYFTRSEQTNVIEVHRKDISITDIKKAKLTSLNGIAIANADVIIANEMAFQTAQQMNQIRRNFNFSCLGGTLQVPTTEIIKGQTQGVLSAISTHKVNLAGALLVQSHIDSIIADLWDDGVDMTGTAFVCDLRTAQAIRDIYGASPLSRNVGGMELTQIVTQAGYTFSILTDTAVNAIQTADAGKKYLGLVNLPMCKVRGLVNPEEGSSIYMKRTSELGAVENKMLIAQLGMDFGVESKHGLLYDFTV